jgi:hypothetical protein
MEFPERGEKNQRLSFLPVDGRRGRGREWKEEETKRKSLN